MTDTPKKSTTARRPDLKPTTYLLDGQLQAPHHIPVFLQQLPGIMV